MKSKSVALSAISSAFISIVLTIGAYVELVDLYSVVIAPIFVIMPLYLKSYKGSIMAFLVGGTIAFLCSGFNFFSIVFPAYFSFSGLYPILKCKMIDKRFIGIKSTIIGLTWCMIAFYGVYCFYVYVAGGIFEGIPEFIKKYLIYIIGIISIIFYFVYDKFIIVIRVFLNKYLSRIIK